MLLETILKKAMKEHQAGDIASAKSLYEQILSQTPDHPDTLNLLGVLHLQCNDLQNAVDLLQRAIDADPDIAEYHYNLGQVLKAKGDISGACDCYRKALLLQPDLEVANAQLEAMDNPAGTFDVPAEQQPQNEMKRYEVVQHVIDAINGRTYLEIGVDSGESFGRTRAQRKIGVDPVPTSELIAQWLEVCDIEHVKFDSSRPPHPSKLQLTAGTTQPLSNIPANESSELFHMTSDAFFAEKSAGLFHTDKIDVAFVDGLHTYEQTYKDVLNVLDHLGDGGVVLMHDCNPPTATSALPATSWEEAAKMDHPGWDGLWCGDVWKSIVYLRSTRKDLNIFVLDCDFGIGVVSKGNPTTGLNYSADQIHAMDFQALDNDRFELLNLQPQAYLFEFLNTLARK